MHAALDEGSDVTARSAGRNVLLQGAGWMLVVVGLAAMMPPGWADGEPEAHESGVHGTSTPASRG